MPKGPENVASVDNFTVKTIVSNTGAETVTLLNDPNSILTPKWKTNTFGLVGPNGVPAKFGGIKVSALFRAVTINLTWHTPR